MPPREPNDPDKPKRSWREIDQRRDGGRSGSTSRGQERFEKSGQYSRFKAEADRFFSGETMPEGLRERIDPTGDAKARRDALARLRSEEDFRKFCEDAKAYVEKYGLPDDPYVLDQLLGHPSEELVRQTLARLSELLTAGELKVPKSLPARLKSLELGSDDPQLQDEARALGRALRDRPR